MAAPARQDLVKALASAPGTGWRATKCWRLWPHLDAKPQLGNLHKAAHLARTALGTSAR